MFQDVGGYIYSPEFLTQLAYLISSIFSVLFGRIISGWFNQP